MKRSRQTIIVSNGTKTFSTPQVECKKIGDNESYRDDPDRPRYYPENGLVSFWLSDDTAQALKDRMLPDETPETALRRRHQCPPGPQPDRSKLDPCEAGGSMLVISTDMHSELIMRSGPGEKPNNLLRRLVVLADIHATGDFTVPTPEQRAWIQADKRAGTDRPRGA
jgi:hypothetical protein